MRLFIQTESKKKKPARITVFLYEKKLKLTGFENDEH
jgi:hypothetical protein